MERGRKAMHKEGLRRRRPDEGKTVQLVCRRARTACRRSLPSCLHPPGTWRAAPRWTRTRTRTCALAQFNHKTYTYIYTCTLSSASDSEEKGGRGEERGENGRLKRPRGAGGKGWDLGFASFHLPSPNSTPLFCAPGSESGKTRRMGFDSYPTYIAFTNILLHIRI
ncbi:hypothetical protein GGS23DRAFT_123112 [Durotheca rogersii]|uniref:uncharacterized protein n=1 Tax=Durotheca rogersii TaxID=419775 RepID=UPI00221E4F63|nr:uncharacterized protein GGS23DRAFT_123112 [Durotheca rogersii]KAI5862020.1 hypothetical protein GGS23DRAFT_123112 [Durotheca rogersii]